jgi:hypothetical protein
LTEPPFFFCVAHCSIGVVGSRHDGASSTQFEAKITGGEAAAPARATPRVVAQVPWRAVRWSVFSFLKGSAHACSNSTTDIITLMQSNTFFFFD